jgi:hypothetical protein
MSVKGTAKLQVRIPHGFAGAGSATQGGRQTLTNRLLEETQLSHTSSGIQLVVVKALSDDFRLAGVRNATCVEVGSGRESFHFENLSEECD